MRYGILCLSLLFIVPSAARADVPPTPQIVAPTGVIESSSFTFSWRASAAATWYQLYIADTGSSSARVQEWFTARQAHCEEGTGVCSVPLTHDLGIGPRTWWVQAWNSEGAQWSAPAQFSVRDSQRPWDVALPASERFLKVLNDEAALDRNTGLVWNKQPSLTLRTFEAAYRDCLTWEGGGFRLPTMEEMRTLLPLNNNRTVPPGYPYVIPAGGLTPSPYWTATPDPNAPTTNHYVLDAQGLIQTSPNGSANSFWCVRGTPGVGWQ